MKLVVAKKKKPIDFPYEYLQKGYIRAYTKKQFDYYCSNEIKTFFYDMKNKYLYINNYYENFIGDYDDGQGGIDMRGYESSKYKVKEILL